MNYPVLVLICSYHTPGIHCYPMQMSCPNVNKNTKKCTCMQLNRGETSHRKPNYANYAISMSECVRLPLSGAVAARPGSVGGSRLSRRLLTLFLSSMSSLRRYFTWLDSKGRGWPFTVDNRWKTGVKVVICTSYICVIDKTDRQSSSAFTELESNLNVDTLLQKQ